MSAITDLDLLLRSLSPSVRDGDYVFVCTDRDLPAEARITESEGTTLVLPRAVADAEGLAYDAVFGWITLEVHSDLAAVGLTAAFSQALAQAGIGCNVVAGTIHDHLFVPFAQAADAMAVLRALQRQAAG